MPLNQDIARWWLRNARIRHGHVPDIPDGLGESRRAPQGFGLGAAAITAALALGGGLAGGAISAILNGTGGPSVVEQGGSTTGSLYQYLEDQNLHLP